MAIFPEIQSPCPYKGNLAAIMDGEVCRLCKRQVFDLTDMSDGERVAFMKGCSSEVCVTYKFPVRPALVAVAIAAAAVAVPTAAAACDDATAEVVVFVGGIKDPANVQYATEITVTAVPQLPIVYENKAADPASPAANTSGSTPDGTPAPINSPAAP